MNAFAQPSPAPVAGPQLDNRRVLAAIVDLVIIFVGSFVLGTIVGLVNGGSAEWTGQMQLITVAWALYYYFAFESGDGQTLGKKLLKIRVVRADGTPAGMREIAVRTVLRVIDGLFMYLVGLIVMLVTGQRRQRLGDLAAGTVVADASATAAPQAGPAAFAPPAPGTAADLDDPELPADAEPREKTPVDIGQPLEGLTPPQPAATPELSDFQPFSPQADEAVDVEDPQAEDEPQSFDEPETFEQPAAFGEREPSVELDTPAEPETFDAPQSFDSPSFEAPAEEDPVDEPAAEATPSFETPAAEETPAFETPAAEVTPSFDTPAEESPSFDTPADEPSFETPAGEPSFETPADGPSFETPADSQPEPADSQPEPADSQPEPAEQPFLSDGPSPAAEAGRTEWPHMYAERASRAYEAEVELSPQPQEPHVDDAPAVEPESEESPSDETPAAAAEDAPAAEEEITFKPIETVSAIDLVMGDQAAQGESSSTESSDEASDSGEQPASGDEPDSGDDRPAGL